MRYPLWEFPSWIPKAVADYVRELIEGPSGDFKGCRPTAEKLTEKLKRMDARLSEINRRLSRLTGAENKADKQQEDEIRRLREQKMWVRAQRKELCVKLKDLDKSVEFLTRLTTYDDMNDCYTRFLRDFTDSQWRDFLCAAWMAGCDFARLRADLKEAAQLQAEIARTAGELRDKVQRLYELEIELPPDMILASVLLERASRIVREDDGVSRSSSRTVLTSHLLQALAEAAGECKPQPVVAKEAMKRRQANLRAEYTRTFAEALTEKGFKLTPRLMNAMSSVVAVALDDPEVTVTYDDVRKALQEKTP